MWLLTDLGQRINTEKLSVYFVSKQQGTPGVWELNVLLQEMDQPLMLAVGPKEEVEAIAAWLDKALGVVEVGKKNSRFR